MGICARKEVEMEKERKAALITAGIVILILAFLGLVIWVPGFVNLVAGLFLLIAVCFMVYLVYDTVLDFLKYN